MLVSPAEKNAKPNEPNKLFQSLYSSEFVKKHPDLIEKLKENELEYKVHDEEQNERVNKFLAKSAASREFTRCNYTCILETKNYVLDQTMIYSLIPEINNFRDNALYKLSELYFSNVDGKEKVSICDAIRQQTVDVVKNAKKYPKYYAYLDNTISDFQSSLQNTKTQPIRHEYCMKALNELNQIKLDDIGYAEMKARCKSLEDGYFKLKEPRNVISNQLSNSNSFEDWTSSNFFDSSMFNLESNTNTGSAAPTSQPIPNEKDEKKIEAQIQKIEENHQKLAKLEKDNKNLASNFKHQDAADALIKSLRDQKLSVIHHKINSLSQDSSYDENFIKNLIKNVYLSKIQNQNSVFNLKLKLIIQISVSIICSIPMVSLFFTIPKMHKLVKDYDKNIDEIIIKRVVTKTDKLSKAKTGFLNSSGECRKVMYSENPNETTLLMTHQQSIRFGMMERKRKFESQKRWNVKQEELWKVEKAASKKRSMNCTR